MQIATATPQLIACREPRAIGFTTPSIYVFDTRVTKSFKFGEKYNLSLIAEAFNLFNRSNIATVNTGRYSIASSSATVWQIRRCRRHLDLRAHSWVSGRFNSQLGSGSSY